MPRASAATPPEPTATQEEATRPRPTDEAGRALDEWGLPLSGPARIRVLAGRTDPVVDPTGWIETAEVPLDVLTVPVPPDPEPEPEPDAGTAPDATTATQPADPAPTED